MVKRKGGKKQVLHLSEFLGDAAPVAPLPVPIYNDDCSTDLSLPAQPAYMPTSSVDLASLPSAPRAQREGSFDPSKIPRNPPFTAFVGNLPFDAEDEDVQKLFQRNTVKEVRLLKDKEDGRFKGFGYVEFETAEGLIEALKLNEMLLRGRSIKVDVATTSGPRDGGGGGGDRWERGRSNDRGDREPYVDNTSDDWRRDSKPQDSTDGPPPYTQRREYRPRRFNDDGEEEDRPPRRYNDSADSFSRSDFGTKMNDAPKEPYKPGRRDEHDDRGDRDRGDRDRGGAWGRSDRSSDSPSDSGGAWVRHGERDQPASRPRLNLKPRTAPLSEEQKKQPEVKEVKKLNPFGNAKPVDIVEKQRSDPEGDDRDARSAAPKSNPFGKAKPADTASWRPSRGPVTGTGPIKTPTPQTVAPDTGKDEVDEIITDSNKFMLLDEEEG